VFRQADVVFAGVLKAVSALATTLAPDGTPYLWGHIFPQVRPQKWQHFFN
jgi:hypothetical protein